MKASGEHWAVTDKISGKLIGFAKCDIHENCCMYTEIKIDPVHLSQYSNYALIYRMNEHYLSERKFLYVCDGLRNILHETNIQKYLINKFNFRRAYCNLNIHYSLLMLILIWILMPFKDIFYRLYFCIFDIRGNYMQ